MKKYFYNYEKSIRSNPKIWHPGFIIHNLIKKEIEIFSNLIKSENKGEVLDFGCGKAPFRKYFTDYKGADIDSENKEPDCIIDPETNKINDLPDESVRNIISVQVIEHVLYIKPYIKEAERLLKVR